MFSKIEVNGDGACDLYKHLKSAAPDDEDATPKQELELVRARLKVAEQHYHEWSKKE